MLKSRCFATMLALIAMAAAALPARAEADPPGRVARVSYLQGDISFQPAGEEDWAVLGMNRPLTTSDRVWTAEKSRTEMHVGNAALRLGPNSGFAFLNLNDNTTQVQLTQGVLNVRLRELGAREAFEVDTPNVALTLLRAGVYRIDVDPDGDVTSITVRSGYAGAGGGGRSFTVHAREQAFFTGTGTPEFSVRGEPGFDAFDEWCAGRDTREDRAVSARYVSRGVIGYEDLDEYGAWQQVPTYGYVWVPSAVAVGWAPYRYGHWSWIGPWGWTWIDDAPWGFAPFHYGRWVWTPAGVWGWAPGPMVVRPWYAPALVAWVGGVHFSVGAPVYGWFPLGYREVYIPWYRASRTYWRQVNVTNVHVTNTYITNIYERHHRGEIEHITYVNQHVNGAVTAVPQRTLVEGRPVGHDHMNVPVKDWKSAEVVHTPPGRPEHNPSASAVNGAPGVRPPRRAVERPVVTRMKPPERPAPFSKLKTGPGEAEARPVPPAATERGPVGQPARDFHRENAGAKAARPGDAEAKPPLRADKETREHGASGNVPPGMGRSTRETFGRPAEPAAAKSATAGTPARGPEMRQPSVGAVNGDSRLKRPAVDLGERRAEAPRTPSAAPVRHEEAVRPMQQARPPEMARPATPVRREEAVRPMQQARPPEMARPAAPPQREAPRAQAPRETPHAQAPREVPRRSAEAAPAAHPQAAPHEQRAPKQQFR